MPVGRMRVGNSLHALPPSRTDIIHIEWLLQQVFILTKTYSSVPEQRKLNIYLICYLELFEKGLIAEFIPTEVAFLKCGL